MIEQLKTIQTGLAIAIDAEGFVDKPVRRALLDAVKAARQLEAMVGEQEPVHQFRSPHCSDWYDGVPDHHDGHGPYEVRTLYAAPVAQQPQEPDWKHPKIQALIGADARNRIVIDLIWQILKDPDGNFSAMDMEYWDSIHDAVQAAVTNAQQPQAEHRECGNSDCGWSGTTDRYLDTIGPLCPECGETTEPVKQPQAEAMTRYCPECGHLGPVGASHRDCCPDGSHARVVPESFAHICAATFSMAIGKQPQADTAPSNCTECRNADSWGMPDQPVCKACKAGSEWAPLNRSSINPNKQPQAEKRCQYCDGSGDVHSIDGQWRGECHCQKQPQADAVPNVCASFLTERADVIGTTKAPIKRVAWEDDGTLHVYIDHWPQQIEASPEKEDFCYCNDEISLQIVSGGAAPEGLYGRVTLKVNGEYVDYVKATPIARSIGEIAGVVAAAQKPILEDVASLCETIRYMVGIAERGTGSKCPDDMRPEVFLLNYVKRLEAVEAPPQAEAVPPGFVLVPVEPTDEMIQGFWGDITHGELEREAAKEAWRKAIDAAIAQQKGSV